MSKWWGLDPFGIFDGVGEKDVNNQFLQNPEYPHSQDARDLWWGKLQDWGKDPNYGAISPDWNDIWSQVQNRVKQYYEGGPLAPGVQDRVNSSLARRGMSENPGSDFLHAQVAAQEGNDLTSADQTQAIAKNQFAEQGRNTWLNSLNSFQAQRPAGEWQTTVQPKNPMGDMLLNGAIQVGTAAATGGISSAAGAGSNAWLSSLLKQQDAPQSFNPGPSGYGDSSSMSKSPLLYWNN